MPAEDSQSGTRREVVSRAEQSRFVEAVVTGKLSPDFTQVVYHFAGWVDKGEGLGHLPSAQI